MAVLISSDSHVMEDHLLWQERLPAAMRERAPRYAEVNASQAHPGGNDPRARVSEMAVDGVEAEILYPTLAMDQFGIADAALQEACFRVYNDWLIEYCAASPDRLFGIGCISLYDIDRALRELERCKNAGLRGALIWQVPPAELSFAGDHYERFWAAAQDLDLPVSLHILTGAPYPPGPLAGTVNAPALDRLHFVVNTKLLHVTDALLDLVGSGVFDRYPRLRVVLVENEISWLPFVVTQWDKYVARGGGFALAKAKRMPGEYFAENVYATFFNDPPIRWFLGQWGNDNFMWSNDFPHPNSTWPKSREVIERDLGHLSAEVRAQLLCENVARLYGLKLPVSG